MLQLHYNKYLMKSIKDIYKIGKGPSSSHTMGPFKAVRHYLEHHPESHHLHVTLYQTSPSRKHSLPGNILTKKHWSHTKEEVAT